MRIDRDTIWMDIQAALLYEAGFPHKEIRKRCGGVSRQRISQRLVKTGIYQRKREYDYSIPTWQLRLAERLLDWGLSTVEVAWLLSLKNATVIYENKIKGRGNYRRPFNSFRTRLVSTAWIESRDYILAAARLDGATLKEIAKLARFAKAEQSAILMKRKFPLIPRGKAGRPRKRLV